MTIQHSKIILRRFCRSSRMLQIVLILGFWLAGEGIVQVIGLPIPGAVAGLFIVLALLISKRLSLRTVRLGARWFLAEMLLFFVPAVLAILNHPEFLGLLGLKILTVIVGSTLTVMVITSAVIDLWFRWAVSRREYDNAQK
ncbi:MAG: CidA/LrgA family protein [Desulfocapsaceae bacterium]|nr:CidA/LrgA family protein [Desulfocapsaceae bacterium]